MNVAVLGAGAWGTALAKLLREQQHEVTVWGHDAGHLEDVRRAGSNERYLPGVALPAGLQFESEFARAVAGREAIRSEERRVGKECA